MSVRALRLSSAKYGAVLRTQLSASLAYPLDLLARGITILIFLWVFLHLWTKTYATMGSTSIEGLSLADTMWYLLLTESIVLSKPRVSTEIARKVRDGSVAYLLNKPFVFPLYELAVGLGDGLLRFLSCFGLGALLVWASVGPSPPLYTWPLAMVAVLLAWVLDFCIAALIGLLAFVTEDVEAFVWIYSKMVLVLGGVLIPLEFFPAWLRTIAQALPFAYTAWAPARLFVDPSAAAFLRVTAAQAAWILALGLALAWAWRAATRRLEINGG